METTLVHELRELVKRKDRFTYDIRSRCQVYDGVVAAYRATESDVRFIDLPAALAHALANDGIIGAWKDPDTGRTVYDSCRLFTDLEHAMRFAREQRQRAIYHITRDKEVPVADPVKPVGQ